MMAQRIGRRWGDIGRGWTLKYLRQWTRDRALVKQIRHWPKSPGMRIGARDGEREPTPQPGFLTRQR